MVGLQKVAVLMHYHIDLRRRGHMIQLQRKGDLPLCHKAHAPPAGHAAHFDNRLVPAQHSGKGRVDLIAHGRKIGQRCFLIRQRPRFLRCAPHGTFPGLLHPVGACGHKTVCRFCTCPQGDAHRHGAILPHTDVQVLDPFAGQLVLDAACRAQLCFLLSARHEVR